MSPGRGFAAAVVAAWLAAAGSAHGGGPLVVATDGSPVGWDPSRPVAYRTDLGGLGTLGSADAVALVGRLFTTWQDVPTATIAFTRAGATAVDVTSANFGPFLGPYGGSTVPSGQSVIVFDADGTIFDTLFGVGTGVLGFAGPTFFSAGAVTVAIGDPVPPGAKIIEGLAFLNGKWIDGIDDPAHGNFEIPRAFFEAVFVHEFGHFAGLDHTQIHGLVSPPASDSPRLTTPVETMFPFAVDETQATLERDDVVAISTLYPTAAFTTSTGRITGRVLKSDRTPFSGVNVIARNVIDDADAVSCLAGWAPVHPGEFTLGGLQPGARYTVEIQEIDAFASDGSRVGPFSAPVTVPGPPEFYNGAAESNDPTADDPAASTPITAAAGVTTQGVDVVVNRQPFTVTNVPLEPGSEPNGFALGDFDRDGILDFVTTQFGIVPGNVIRFFRGRGGGVFAPPVTVASFPGNAHVVAGQLNRGADDWLDIAVASDSLRQVRVYLGAGTGGFGAPTTVVAAPGGGLPLAGLVVGDLNGDAFPDLVTLAENADGSATAYGLLGSASGQFTVVASPLAAGSGFPRGGLALGRFAGSGANDVIGIASTGGFSGPPALGLLIGDGGGGFAATRVSLAAITNAVGASALAAADLDGDGTLDVAVSDLFPLGGPNNWTRSFVDLLHGDGAGGFTFAARYAVPESFQDSIVAADLDGDGHVDLASTGAWFGPGNPGAKVTIAHGDGTGGVRDVTTIHGLAEFPTKLVAADLDGDGRLDLLVDDGESEAFGLTPRPAYSVLLQAGPAGPAGPVCRGAPAGTPCDDGDPTTDGDACDGSGSCVGRAVTAHYAVVGGPSVALGSGARSVGALCADALTLDRSGRGDGNLVAMQRTGTAITLAKSARVTGRAVTGGGVIGGLAKARVDGGVDISGTAPELGGCAAARSAAGVRRVGFGALAPTATSGAVAVPAKASRTLVVGGQRGVLDLPELRLGSRATLVLVADPGVTAVIVRVAGTLVLGSKATVVLRAGSAPLGPEAAIFMVGGPVSLGANAVIPGTVLAAGDISLGTGGIVNGALVAAGRVLASGTSVVTLHPFVGW